MECRTARAAGHDAGQDLQGPGTCDRAMSHADFVARYAVPVAVRDAPRPTLVSPQRAERLVRCTAGELRRRLRGRRLAYIDSHFPWRRSGFRYADALALHEARPDTVFFSMYEMTDPFPARVLPLAQFPRLAPSLGVTDVYGVFLGFMGGVLGVHPGYRREPSVTDGPDLSEVLRRHRIRVHAGLYPGGGFTLTETGFADACRLVAAADQVFSWIPSALERLPGVTPIDAALIDTAFYSQTTRDFAARPLELLFAADARPRKGLDVALAAVRELGDAPVHLHVVGPHTPEPEVVAAGRVTFHGWLEPDALRDLHRRCQVFVSPVRSEEPGDDGGDGGVTDGFPTAAACEAVSSGLLLMTANPEADHRAMRPGTDHVEVDATPAAVGQAIESVLADPHAAAAVAASGARRVRERFDVRRGASTRLTLMGLAHKT